MHVAFSRLLAGNSDPVLIIDRVVTQAFELFDGNVKIDVDGFPELACRKNCPSCCTLRVTATAPEILLLAHYVRLIEATPSGAQLNLSRRIAEADRATEGLNEKQRVELSRPCPLILKGVCIVHPVRPLACRGHASFDRQACARAAEGHNNVEVPVSELHLGMRALVQSALQSALRRSDRAWGLYELNHGLRLALDGNDRRAAWVRGEDSLAPAISDLDASAMAQTFDALLGTSTVPSA
jgi:Fe-S-cluster containining protein